MTELYYSPTERMLDKFPELSTLSCINLLDHYKGPHQSKVQFLRGLSCATGISFDVLKCKPIMSTISVLEFTDHRKTEEGRQENKDRVRQQKVDPLILSFLSLNLLVHYDVNKSIIQFIKDVCTDNGLDATLYIQKKEQIRRHIRADHGLEFKHHQSTKEARQENEQRGLDRSPNRDIIKFLDSLDYTNVVLPGESIKQFSARIARTYGLAVDAIARCSEHIKKRAKSVGIVFQNHMKTAEYREQYRVLNPIVKAFSLTDFRLHHKEGMSAKQFTRLIAELYDIAGWESCYKSVMRFWSSRGLVFIPHHSTEEGRIANSNRNLHRFLTRFPYMANILNDESVYIEGQTFNDFLQLLASKHNVTFETLNTHRTVLWSRFAHLGFESTPKSALEVIVLDFIASLGIQYEQGNRSLISPQELDIVLPEQNLAIEINGTYWHSTKFKHKNYHLDKTVLAETMGYQLLHIWDTEVLDPVKWDIWKSTIRTKLGLIVTRIPARKCTFGKVKPDAAKEFLSRNHLQGATSGQHYGLYFGDELVSILTIGKSRFKKNEVELLRFCSKLNTIVQGGFSKLLKIAKSDHGTIITYANRRWSKGHTYTKCGNFITSTPPNYWYLVNGKLESRHNYQKHKLKNILPNFDPNLTEFENMELHGIDRLYDSGNLKFEL